jgi:hypothetical protein
MKNIKEIIENNQAEFNEMVINFVSGKSIKKRKKSPKTVCHFSVMGKKYDSNVFTINYMEFLGDISRINTYNLFQKTLGTFTKNKLSDFTDTTRKKATVIELKCGGYVSTYSSTKIKMEHIKSICNEVGCNVVYDVK